MPVINANIPRAWRHTGEVGRIHYMIDKVDGSERHLKVDEGEALYDVLEEHLAAQDYTGPQEGEEDVA